MKVDEIEPDTILWVTTIVEAFNISAVQLLVEDKKSNVIQLALYNMHDKESRLPQIQKQFP